MRSIIAVFVRLYGEVVFFRPKPGAPRRNPSSHQCLRFLGPQKNVQKRVKTV